MELAEPFEHLCQIMQQLRSEEGCPWDRQQTPSSLIPYIIEEAYELIDAIEDGDHNLVREELGDLLLQVVFQAQIYSEIDAFDIDDVAAGIARKLIRRHPHVFTDGHQEQDIHVVWDQIKAGEKGATLTDNIFSGIPRQLPALQRCQKMLTKLSRHNLTLDGLSHPGASSDTSPANNSVTTEGDLARQMVTLVQQAIDLGVDAETLLREHLQALAQQKPYPSASENDR